MRRLFGVLRLLAAAAIIVAIVGQFAHSLALVPNPALFIVNFFSFFTILSNALAAIVLLIGAWYCVRTERDPDWYNLVRAAVVTYMATTLVVYNLLLRDISLDQATTLPWSNEILHVWAPLYLVLDWIFAPGRGRVPWSRFWWIAAFPIAWVVYTIIRGPIADWYSVSIPRPRDRAGRRFRRMWPSTSSRSRRSSCSSGRASSGSASCTGRTAASASRPATRSATSGRASAPDARRRPAQS